MLTASAWGVLVVGLLLSGCEEFPITTKPATSKTVKVPPLAKESRVPVRRFILTKYDAGVAFDSQTGQLCRTWEWALVNKPAAKADESGNVPQVHWES
jgi:hypothetical protein